MNLHIIYYYVIVAINIEKLPDISKKKTEKICNIIFP